LYKISAEVSYSSILHGGIHHPTLRTWQSNGRTLTKSSFYPIFISDDADAEEVIPTLPGQKRWGLNKLEGFLGPLIKKGLKGVILFGVPMKMEKVCWFGLDSFRRMLIINAILIGCKRFSSR
jgi:porphobilinogen synthase